MDHAGQFRAPANLRYQPSYHLLYRAVLHWLLGAVSHVAYYTSLSNDAGRIGWAQLGALDFGVEDGSCHHNSMGQGRLADCAGRSVYVARSKGAGVSYCERRSVGCLYAFYGAGYFYPYRLLVCVYIKHG